MSIAEAAWLAGFIDGEGSITRYMAGKAKNPAWMISVANTEICTLQKCLEISGCGAIHKKKDRAKKPHHKESFSWVVSGQNDIQSVLAQIEPYLTCKRDRALTCIAEWRGPIV